MAMVTTGPLASGQIRRDARGRRTRVVRRGRGRFRRRPRIEWRSMARRSSDALQRQIRTASGPCEKLVLGAAMRPGDYCLSSHRPPSPPDRRPPRRGGGSSPCTYAASAAGRPAGPARLCGARRGLARSARALAAAALLALSGALAVPAQAQTCTLDTAAGDLWCGVVTVGGIRLKGLSLPMGSWMPQPIQVPCPTRHSRWEPTTTPLTLSLLGEEPMPGSCSSV